MRAVVSIGGGLLAAALLAAPAWAHHQHDHDEGAAPAPTVQAAPSPADAPITPVPVPPVPAHDEESLPAPVQLPGGGLLQARVHHRRLDAQVTVTGDRPQGEIDPALPLDVAATILSRAGWLSDETRSFVVFSFGQPLGGAQVTLSTQGGWRKTLVTGVNGQVVFSVPNTLRGGMAMVEIQADSRAPGLWRGEGFDQARLRGSWAGEVGSSASALLPGGGLAVPLLAGGALLLAGLGLILRKGRKR